MKSENQGDISEDPATSINVSQRPLTIGHAKQTPFALLAHTVHLGKVDWKLKQLLTLSGPNETDSAREWLVRACVAFLASPEILIILGRWAAENKQAAALLRLGRVVAEVPGLPAQLRLYEDDQVTRKRLHGQLEANYLAAMVAVRRPYQPQEPHVERWIQHLRVFLLIRAIEALEVGAASEPTLRDACMAARKACDTSPNDHLTWLGALAAETRSFADFCDDLVYRTHATQRPRAWPKAAGNLYGKLGRIARGGEWWDPRALSARPGVDDVIGQPDPGIPRPPRSAPPSLPDGVDAAPVHMPTGKGEGLSLFLERPRKNSTPHATRRHGTETLLIHIEETLYLPPSWHHLADSERKGLLQRIDSLLSDSAVVNRVGAAISLVALATNRSIFHAEVITLSSGIGDDWALEPGTWRLRRLPPRFERGIELSSLGEDAACWVHALLPHWEIELCVPAREALATLPTSDPSAQEPTLGELWNRLNPEQTLTQWFSIVLASTPGILRLTGPGTANVLASRIYGRTRDSVLARIVSSQPRIGLPASCAYAAYRSSDILDSIGEHPLADLITFSHPSPNDENNGAGSELDVRLDLVAGAMSDLRARYELAAADPSRWEESHNLLCSLVVLAMFGSTGGRPVNSPFESLLQFDTKRQIVYVEDKVSGPTRGARICVLSDFACALVRDVYVPHLSRLSRLLADQCPELSAAIAANVETGESQNLPLFFYLKGDPEMYWLEVSETTLDEISGIQWPLPWNVFRHLSATHLNRSRLPSKPGLPGDQRLHPEIIDALLGHGDRGVESHGDNSARIPEQDIEAARPHVNALQVKLGFSGTIQSPALPLALAANATEAPHLFTATFGRAARRQARTDAHNAARERALDQILALVGKKAPETLSVDAWQAIADKMIFREDGMPHPSASLRYEVFEEYVGNLWKERRQLTKLHRTYRPIPEPDALFGEDFIEAHARMLSIARSFEFLVTRNGSIARPTPMLAAALAAIELIVHCRICHLPLLMALTRLRRNLRLIKFDRRYWIEWANADVWVDGKPVLRAEVTSRGAKWIGIALSSKRRDMAEAPMPQALQELAASACQEAPTMRQLLGALSRSQGQVNAWELPGTDAAYFSGRNAYCALPHADWIRATHGFAPVLASEPSDDGDIDDDDDIAAPVGTTDVTSKPGTSAARCAILLDGITRCLPKEGGDLAKAITEIRRLTAESGFAKGEAPQVLAHFVCFLLGRKRKTGKRTRLKPTTARRYWYSLSGPFIDLAHDLSLTAADADEITEFYESIVEWWDAHPDTPTDATTDATAAVTNTTAADQASKIDAYDSARRTLAQLKDFHDFAARKYGVEEPDWSEIDLGARAAVGRPGYVSDAEVESALTHILGSGEATALSDHWLALAAILILCARFGLRIGEAVGIMRSDWINAGGTVVLLVRANSTRPLKNRRSRRQVPLLQALTTAEQSIIDEVIRRWTLNHARDSDGPLLPGMSRQEFRRFKAATSADLLELLKHVTCNDRTTIHMLRHSFATKVACILRGQGLGTSLIVTSEQTEHARRLLLGSPELDRRAWWALARALGHTTPRTGIRCYTHGIDQWLTPLVSLTPWAGGGISVDAYVDLDIVERDPVYRTSWKRSATTIEEESLALRRARFLQLIGQGYVEEQAATTARLSNVEAADVAQLLCQIPEHREANSTKLIDSPIIRSIGATRLRVLANMISLFQPPQQRKSHAEASNPVIGLHRHIVLFKPAHFEMARHFIETLALTDKDVAIVTPDKVSSRVTDWISENSLAKHRQRLNQMGRWFQLDAIELGDPPEPIRHRAVLVPRQSSEFIKSTQELALLWLLTTSAVQSEISNSPASSG